MISGLGEIGRRGRANSARIGAVGAELQRNTSETEAVQVRSLETTRHGAPQ